ncbi:unnamed protein product, partial [marine sediment metagenome]
ANSVSYTGANPVFMDVSPDTWLMDEFFLDLFCLNVDLYGNPSEISSLFGLEIVDAAESIGAFTVRDFNIACYSLNGNKTMSTGSGGLVIGNDLEKVRELADAGRVNGEYNSIGYNYRMNGMAAEMGLRQLPYLDKWVAKKRRFNQIYTEGILVSYHPLKRNGIHPMTVCV